jgi:hypothetical protein
MPTKASKTAAVAKAENRSINQPQKKPVTDFSIAGLVFSCRFELG